MEDDDSEEEEEDDKDKDEKDDDGDSDSDGYGEAGLSFESILADVRGDIKESQLHLREEVNRAREQKKKQAVVAKKKLVSSKKNREVRKGTVSFIKDNAGVDASSSQKKKKPHPRDDQRVNAATCSRCKTVVN